VIAFKQSCAQPAMKEADLYGVEWH
jgi:hypothetical protein